MRSSDARRVAKIITIVAQEGLRLAARLVAATWRGHDSRWRARAAADAVTDTLIRLGPAFTKAGQILAVRADLLPSELTGALSRLYDDVASPVGLTIEGAFRAEFGFDPVEVFDTWDQTPVACASVAVVYRAWLCDGTSVAVKILRPGIADDLHSDLRVLRRLTGVIARLPAAREMPIVPMVEEISTWLARQVDLRHEAAAARQLHEALAPHSSIVVPRLIDELCGSTVLTMTYLQPDRRHGPHLQGLSLEAALAILQAVYRMIFVEGLIHCDLHPGNILHLDDGRVGLIDFGFVAHLNTSERLAFARFFYAMAVGDGHACAQVAIETASSVRDGFDRVAFEDELTAMIRTTAGAATDQFHVARFVSRLFKLMRRHGLRGTIGFTMAVVALVNVEGLIKTSGVNVDFQAQARPYLLRASLRGARIRSPDPLTAMARVLTEQAKEPTNSSADRGSTPT